MNALYGKYGQVASFFVVYIGEAHPSDAWQLPENLRAHVVFASPADFKERSELADICVVKLGIKVPAVVDRFDDATETAYSGWPDRLYVIDADGRVAYKSKPGPYGFKPAEMEGALKRVLARPIAARFPS